jgi:enoyl-CoA hydratase/carnithine racemase
MAMSITVTTQPAGPHVAEVRFSKPPFNYACPDLLEQIADALDAIDADPEIRCSVLSAEGKAFCAGADLAGDEAIAGNDGMAAIGRLYVQAERLFRRRKPMVAAIHGAAIGAGLGLSLAADFRVAGPGARFSSNFVRLGFHPGFGLTHTLARVVGIQKANWLMLSAERMKPDDALACGLADRLSGEDCAGAARAMAGEIVANAPLALIAVRRTMVGGLADAAVAAMRHEHAEQTALWTTADYAEGVASVFERRDAHFTGR